MADITSGTSEIDKEHIEGSFEYNGQVYNYDFVYDKNNPSTGLDIFYHGYYGGSDVASVMRYGDYNVQPILDSYESSISSGLIVYHNYSTDRESYLEACDLIAQDVSNKYGVTFNNINRSGASYGDNYALAGGIKYNLENNVQTPNFISLYGDRIWEDNNPFSGTNNGYINTLSEEELSKALGNTYLVAYGDNGSIDRIKDYTAGVILVKGPGLDHDNGYKNAMKLNSVDFCNGYGDLNISDNYSISYYSPETGWLNNISLDELKEKVPNISSGIRSVYNLSAGSSIDLIQSDGSYLENELADISGILKATRINNANVSADSISSTTNVPSREPEITMKMLNACKVLFEKIYTELVMIKEVGDEFARMDNFLADMSTQIGMEVQSVKVPTVELELSSAKSFDYEIPESIVTETNKLKEEYGVSTETPEETENTSSKPSTYTPSGSSGGSSGYTPGGSSGGGTPSTPAQDSTPNDETPNDETPKDETPNDETPKDETPNDETPKDEPPKDETPKDETPKDETPKDETPKDETPNDETPKDETPNDETPKDETPKEETASKAPSPQKTSTSNKTSSSSSSSSKKLSSSSSSSSSNSNQTSDQTPAEQPPIVDIPESSEDEIPIVPEEPITPEETIPEAPIVDMSLPETESVVPQTPSTTDSGSKLGSTLKTIGGLTGIGAAVGAGVYATHKVLENKKNKEDQNIDYSNYNYESDYETDDNSEIGDMQLNPFMSENKNNSESDNG